MADQERAVKTYRGNCHCGAFVYEVDLPAEIKQVSECNCSVCSKKGYVWAFPAAGSYKVINGDEKDLSMYTFGKNTVRHYFCPTCGTGLMARDETRPPGGQHIVNLRAIQGPLDLFSAERKIFDGAAIPCDWKPTEYKGSEPQGGPADAKTYHGSCHCGAVTFALRHKPLDELEPLNHDKDADRIIECNCSICHRNGYVWLYPSVDQVVIQGREHLTLYSMGSGAWNKPFCRTCGMAFTNETADLTAEQIAALPERKRHWWESSRAGQPINLRLLDDFDFKTLPTRKLDGYNIIPPQYVNP